MAEIILEIIVVWLLSYPVAFVRWMIGGFRKGKFRQYLEADWYMNLLYITLAAIVVKLLFVGLR